MRDAILEKPSAMVKSASLSLKESSKESVSDPSLGASVAKAPTAESMVKDVGVAPTEAYVGEKALTVSDKELTHTITQEDAPCAPVMKQSILVEKVVAGAMPTGAANTPLPRCSSSSSGPSNDVVGVEEVESISRKLPATHMEDTTVMQVQVEPQVQPRVEPRPAGAPALVVETAGRPRGVEQVSPMAASEGSLTASGGDSSIRENTSMTLEALSHDPYAPDPYDSQPTTATCGGDGKGCVIS